MNSNNKYSTQKNKNDPFGALIRGGTTGGTTKKKAPNLLPVTQLCMVSMYLNITHCRKVFICYFNGTFMLCIKFLVLILYGCGGDWKDGAQWKRKALIEFIFLMINCNGVMFILVLLYIRQNTTSIIWQNCHCEYSYMSVLLYLFLVEAEVAAAGNLKFSHSVKFTANKLWATWNAVSLSATCPHFAVAAFH